MMILRGGEGGDKTASLGDPFHRRAESIRALLSEERKPDCP
jgi:hypothetical protein